MCLGAKTCRIGERIKSEPRTKARSCKTAPPVPVQGLREQRAQEFIEQARERKRHGEKQSFETRPEGEGMLAVCVLHGIPSCKKCRRCSEKAKHTKTKSATQQVECTSLAIGSRPATQQNRPGTGDSTQRPSTSAGGRTRLSDIEQQLQTRLFRHKKAEIEAACDRFDQNDDGFLCKESFLSLLGVLALHPGQEKFEQLWQQYDPKNMGRISHSSWLHRFVASVSLPEGSLPPTVIAKGNCRTANHQNPREQFGEGAATNRSGMSSQRDSNHHKGVQRARSRTGSRPSSVASRFSIDCGAASVNGDRPTR